MKRFILYCSAIAMTNCFLFTSCGKSADTEISNETIASTLSIGNDSTENNLFEIVPVKYEKYYEVVDFWGEYPLGAYSQTFYEYPTIKYHDSSHLEIESIINQRIESVIAENQKITYGEELSEVGSRECAASYSCSFTIDKDSLSMLAITINTEESGSESVDEGMHTSTHLIFDPNTGEEYVLPNLIDSQKDFREYIADQVLRSNDYNGQHGYVHDIIKAELSSSMNQCYISSDSIIINDYSSQFLASVPLDNCAFLLNDDGQRLLGYNQDTIPKSVISRKEYYFYRYLATNIIPSEGWSHTSEGQRDYWTLVSFEPERAGIIGVYIWDNRDEMLTVKLEKKPEADAGVFQYVITLYTLQNEEVIEKYKTTLNCEYHELRNETLYVGNDYLCLVQDAHDYLYDFTETANADIVTLFSLSSIRSQFHERPNRPYDSLKFSTN